MVDGGKCLDAGHWPRMANLNFSRFRGSARPHEPSAAAFLGAGLSKVEPLSVVRREEKSSPAAAGIELQLGKQFHQADDLPGRKRMALPL